jgi:hypothetical protein
VTIRKVEKYSKDILFYCENIIHLVPTEIIELGKLTGILFRRYLMIDDVATNDFFVVSEIKKKSIDVE